MIGLYVHIPFCTEKCPYCDFYSARYDKGLAYSYAEAVKRNLINYDEIYDTVYFGGGTPSLLSWEITQMMGAAMRSDNAEVTFEANPDSVSMQNLIMLKNSGVNRISIGVQSFSDTELNSLGRRHTAQTAINAIRLAYDGGFRNISVDLMLGIPYQTPASVKRTIEMVGKMPITHVSAYLLKVEPNTPFASYKDIFPAEDAVAKVYLLAVENLERLGFKQYEISNFAKPGFECKHNLKYWKSQEYLGIGAGSHSYYLKDRFYVEKDIKKFINSTLQDIVITEEDSLTFEDYAMLKLRLTEGLSYDECKRFGVKRDTIQSRLVKLPPEYIKELRNGVSLTPKGYLVSNTVISKIIHG